MGYTDIVQAANGAEGLEQAQDDTIGLVLSDWNMPEMNGYEFLVKFKSLPHGKQTPFIMVTTEAEKSTIVRAIQAGANNYVLKPFTEEDLKAKIEQTLAKMKAEA